MSDRYEIRRDRVTLCASTVPDLGYSPETLRDMDRSGLHLYRNGKRVKLPKKPTQQPRKDNNHGT